MQIGDTLFITMGVRPRQALEFIITGIRGSTTTFYDVRCARCGQRTAFELGDEVAALRVVAESSGIHSVNINDVNSNLTRTHIVGHRRRCWETQYGLPSTISVPLSVTMTTTGTTGTTGPGDQGIRMARGGRVPHSNFQRARSYGEELKNKLINERKKKKIKLPEFRLIRDE